MLNRNFKKIFFCFLYYFSYVIPKDKTLWVFGSWYGNRYADNSRYFFEYIVSNQPQINAVWFTINKEIHKNLTEKGLKCIYGINLQSIYLCLRAKIAVVCQSREVDLPEFINPNVTNIIQLWHGVALKKILNDVTKKENNALISVKKNNFSIVLKKYWNKLISVLENEKYALVISTSEETKRVFSKAFGNNAPKIVISGYPRNDIILSENKKPFNEKKIIYMPTFRKVGESVDVLGMIGFDFEKTNQFLKKNDVVLCFKLHPVSKPSDTLLEQINVSTNIELFPSNEDIYPLLNQFDILITDYSSIYFDFLLLNRPIIFCPFDLDYYSEDRGLYYEYNTCTPGYKAKNWDEVLTCIELSIKKDAYAQKRKEILEKFHFYKDNQSSFRVHKEIMQLLDKQYNVLPEKSTQQGVASELPNNLAEIRTFR